MVTTFLPAGTEVCKQDAALTEPFLAHGTMLGHGTIGGASSRRQWHATTVKSSTRRASQPDVRRGAGGSLASAPLLGRDGLARRSGGLNGDRDRPHMTRIDPGNGRKVGTLAGARCFCCWGLLGLQRCHRFMAQSWRHGALATPTTRSPMLFNPYGAGGDITDHWNPEAIVLISGGTPTHKNSSNKFVENAFGVCRAHERRQPNFQHKSRQSMAKCAHLR